MEDFVTVGTYLSTAEAEPPRLALEAAGIPAMATDENIGELLVPVLFGGIKLQVPAKDAEQAREILAEFKREIAAEAAEAGSDDEGVSLKCPSAAPISGFRRNAAVTSRSVPSAGPTSTCRRANRAKVDASGFAPADMMQVEPPPLQKGPVADGQGLASPGNGVIGNPPAVAGFHERTRKKPGCRGRSKLGESPPRQPGSSLLAACL